MWFCSECGDQFDPVEYRQIDPDGENFCSSECEDEWNATEELAEIYFESRYGAAPLF